MASIVLSLVTAVWIIIQIGRFLDNWKEERRLRYRARIAEARADAAAAVAKVIALQGSRKSDSPPGP